MNYLALCNKVIEETGVDHNLLTEANWSSFDTNRRVYPRVKRLVAEAWKMIQMSKLGWEWQQKQLNIMIYPRVRFQEGSRTTVGSLIGTVWKGVDSGFTFTVLSVPEISGDWLVANAAGMFEFTLSDVGYRLIPGEVFEEQGGDGVFIYTEKGNYDFSQVDPLLRELGLTTFVAAQDKYTPIPITYIPWDNWLYKELSFAQGSRTVPTYLSIDPTGKVVFYPQTIDPFRVSFYYDTSPQVLSAPTDIPVGIPEEYHEWIAWQAALNIARYDKNMTTAAYAADMAKFYELQATNKLTPTPQWGANPFNYSDYWRFG